MTSSEETQIRSSENLEEVLIKELEAMFNRERLEKNNYFIYRMSMNLEIPLQAVYEERSIKTITQDSQLVLNALKKTANVKVNEEKEIFVPIIKSMTNKIILNIQAKEEEEFKKFLQTELWTNNDYVLVFDRPNSGRMIFNKESDSELFLSFIKNKKFLDKDLEGYIEPENIFLTFLQNAQESKKSYAYQDTKYSSSSHREPNSYYSGSNPPGYNMYQSGYPMMNSNPYYYPYYPPYNNSYPYYNPYISSMYIRKAKNEDDYNEENFEERHETYSKPNYWVPENSKNQEFDQDYHKSSQGKYSSYPPKRGKRGGRYSRGGGYKRFNDSSMKNTEGNRVRLNSDNFPPLITENDKDRPKYNYDEKEKQEIAIKYKKNDIVKVHQDMQSKGEIKIDSKLATMKEEEMPFLNAHFSLRKKSNNN